MSGETPDALKKRIVWKESSPGALRAFYGQGELMQELKWFPQSGSQMAFLSCPLLEVLYEGARGPGKTDALLMSFLQHVGKGYGSHWNGIIFRRTYKELEDLEEKAKRLIHGQLPMFPNAKFNHGTHTWRFRGGELLRFSYLKRDKDAEVYQGREIPFIGFEELTNFPSIAPYLILFACCRSSSPGIPRMVRATANPHGPGHNWVKRRFQISHTRPMAGGRGGGMSPVVRDKETGVRRVAIHGHYKENRVLLCADPDYESRLMVATSKNPHKRQAWVDGSWDILSGGMFDDLWDASTHVVSPFPVPSSWRIDRSFDWGSSAPFSVGWWAESNGEDVMLADGSVMSTVRGDLFRIYEWYGSEPDDPTTGLRLTSTQIARGIVEREVRWNIRSRAHAGPADSSIWNQDRGDSIADEMDSSVVINSRTYRGVSWTRADKKPGTRKLGWELIRGRLLASLSYDPSTKEPQPREKPGIFVFSRCTRFLELLPYTPRDEDDPDEIADNTPDHLQDEVRYRVLEGASMTARKTRGFQ